MKKVLALVLAVMMLATTAFAVVNNPEAGDQTYDASKRPGSTIEITAIGIQEKDGNYQFVDSGTGKVPDGKLLLKALNSTNYSITNIKFTDGKNLVDGNPKFNDAKDQLEIKLKQDYTNTKEKPLNMSFKLKGKKVGKSEKPADIDVQIVYTVGYTLDKETLYIDSGIDTLSVTTGVFTDKKTLFEVDKATGADSYVTLEFSAEDGDTDVEVRVYDGDKLYLYNDVDAKTDVLKKYADADADITFLNFPGEPTFNATATVRFYKEEGTYIYIWKDGKLSAVTAATAAAGSAGQTAGRVTWDEDEGCYILKTRQLAPTYVFSDVALAVDAADATDTTPANPDTGANDVVGIATALAAVALVSAAAVSLKK